MKNDGNNVNLDREARLLSENALRFSIASNLMHGQIQSIDRRSRKDKAHETVCSTQIGDSGMAAERVRAETLTENLANAETTRTPAGGPYRRKDVEFESTPVTSPFSSVFDAQVQSVDGVQVSDIVTDFRA